MSLATATVVKELFGLFKSGGTEEQANKLLSPVIEGYKAELASGDGYTRKARPTLIYLCALIIFNDFILRPYVNIWVTDDIPVMLNEQKFQLLIALLTSLGLARSILDKQGKWVEKIAGRIFKNDK